MNGVGSGGGGGADGFGGGGGGGGGGAGADEASGPTESDDAAASVPLAAEVRLAGVENKEKMYEPKHNRKLVRVLTVVAYVFSVSLAAIMLSLYYVFLWKPPNTSQHQDLLNRHNNNKSFLTVPTTLGTVAPPATVTHSKVPPLPSPQTSLTWQNVFSRMDRFYLSSTASSEDFMDTTETVPTDFLLEPELGASLRAFELPTQESASFVSPAAFSAHSPPTLPSAPSPLPPPPLPPSVNSFAGSVPSLHQIVMGRHLPPDGSSAHHLRNSHYRGRDRNDVEINNVNRFSSIRSLGGT